MAELGVQLLQDLKTRTILLWLPQCLNSQESTRNAGDAQKWVPSLGQEDSPWRRKCQPTPVLLPGKFHGQRILVGYSPWSHKRVGHNLATKHQHPPVLSQQSSPRVVMVDHGLSY